MKRVLLAVILFAAASGFSSIAACSGGAGNAVIPGQDGGLPQIGGAEAWGNIPVYPGAREAYKIQGNETSGPDIWTTIHGIYDTSASVADVGAFYQDKMPANGWELNSWNELGHGVMADYTKNDGKATAVIMISSTDNIKTLLTIDKKYLK